MTVHASDGSEQDVFGLVVAGRPFVLDRALRVIDRNAAAQARLIDDMLDMARIVSGKLRLQMGPVDLVAATLPGSGRSGGHSPRRA